MPPMSKVELFTAIRRDSRAGMSVRALARKPDDAHRDGQLADDPQVRIEARAAVERDLTSALMTLSDREQAVSFNELRPRLPVDVAQLAGLRGHPVQ